jgi:hypothetical protein
MPAVANTFTGLKAMFKESYPGGSSSSKVFKEAMKPDTKKKKKFSKLLSMLKK